MSTIHLRYLAEQVCCCFEATPFTLHYKNFIDSSLVGLYHMTFRRDGYGFRRWLLLVGFPSETVRDQNALRY